MTKTPRIYACTSGQWSYTHTGTSDFGQRSIVDYATIVHEQREYSKPTTTPWVKVVKARMQCWTDEAKLDLVRPVVY